VKKWVALKRAGCCGCEKNRLGDSEKSLLGGSEKNRLVLLMEHIMSVSYPSIILFCHGTAPTRLLK